MKQAFPVILASGSPRRQALLKEMGIIFKVVTRDVDETFPDDMHRENVALFLAQKKSKIYDPEIEQGNVVITADTIVCIGDELLNKPQNHIAACSMLQKLSGKAHQVITGVCIRSRKFTESFHVSTTVVFKKLSDSEINFYVENYKPFDKAGAYGIQEWIGLTGIERIEGSYYNVVGLPVKELYEKLVELGVITAI